MSTENQIQQRFDLEDIVKEQATSAAFYSTIVGRLFLEYEKNFNDEKKRHTSRDALFAELLHLVGRWGDTNKYATPRYELIRDYQEKCAALEEDMLGWKEMAESLRARVAELEVERDDALGEMEGAQEQLALQPWPKWVERILSELKKLGCEYDPGEEIDLPADFMDHVNAWVQGIERDAKAKLTTALTEVEVLRGVLEQARIYVETDEEAHGRQLGVGNAIRAALARGKP